MATFFNKVLAPKYLTVSPDVTSGETQETPETYQGVLMEPTGGITIIEDEPLYSPFPSKIQPTDFPDASMIGPALSNLAGNINLSVFDEPVNPASNSMPKTKFTPAIVLPPESPQGVVSFLKDKLLGIKQKIVPSEKPLKVGKKYRLVFGAPSTPAGLSKFNSLKGKSVSVAGHGIFITDIGKWSAEGDVYLQLEVK